MVKKSELISILEQTKIVIENDYERFVCIAIHETDGSSIAKEYLINWIHIMMNGSYKLESWLYEKHRIKILDYSIEKNKLKETRIKWIDYMINQIKTTNYLGKW